MLTTSELMQLSNKFNLIIIQLHVERKKELNVDLMHHCFHYYCK